MADENEDPKPEVENPSSTPSPNPNPKSPSSVFTPPSLNIWPPSQRTREAVTGRLVETLTSPSSVLAKRYGVIPSDVAAVTAAEIEKEAFAAAEASAGDEAKTASVDGGLELLEIYSKAISRRMLEMVKAGNRAGSAAPSQLSVASLSIEDEESRGGESAEAEAPAAA